MTVPSRGAAHAINPTSETIRILKPFLPLAVLATLLGIGNGLSVTALIATINALVTDTIAADLHTAWKFAGLCVVIAGSGLLSNSITIYIGQHVLVRLRKELAERILTAPIDQLERYGSHKLIPILVHDTNVLSTFVLSVAPLVVAFSVTVAGVIYLSILSLPIVLMTLSAIVVGIGAQCLAYRWGIPKIDAARAAEDDLQKHYEAISEGAKELRMHRPRRHRLLTQNLYGTTERICNDHIGAAKFFITAETFGSILFFIVIGLAIVAQTLWLSSDKTVLGGFVFIMLYLKGPISQLNDALPIFSRAQVSLKRILELNSKLSAAEECLLIEEKILSDNDQATAVNTIELRNVHYRFSKSGDCEQFELGPIDLTIKRGDIVFIVGENGSGKTTLIKLLLGLYSPHKGSILLNGAPVSINDRDNYRQLFTTIFSDYYLFDDLSPGSALSQESTQKYLDRLDLAHKINVREGVFSSTDLSTGQRKRLALLNAWLEKRPILMFDEWAADQDPSFRRVFYTELLPELKRLGKTIIAISHDDRYFDVADHIVHMERGRLSLSTAAA